MPFDAGYTLCGNALESLEEYGGDIEGFEGEPGDLITCEECREVIKAVKAIKRWRIPNEL